MITRLEDAVAILNEYSHRHAHDWSITVNRYGNRVAYAQDMIYWLTEFEACAVADRLRRQRPSNTPAARLVRLFRRLDRFSRDLASRRI